MEVTLVTAWICLAVIAVALSVVAFILTFGSKEGAGQYCPYCGWCDTGNCVERKDR